MLRPSRRPHHGKSTGTRSARKATLLPGQNTIDQFFTAGKPYPHSAPAYASRLAVRRTTATFDEEGKDNFRGRPLRLAGDGWKRREVLAPYYDVPFTHFNALTIGNDEIQRVVSALTYACDWHDLEAVEEHIVVQHLQTITHMPCYGVPDRKVLRQTFTDAVEVYAWAVWNIAWYMFSEPNPIFADCDISPDLHFNRAWHVLRYVKHYLDTQGLSEEDQAAGCEPLSSISSSLDASQPSMGTPDLTDKAKDKKPATLPLYKQTMIHCFLQDNNPLASASPATESNVVTRQHDTTITNRQDSTTVLIYTTAQTGWALLSDAQLTCNPGHHIHFPSKAHLIAAMEQSQLWFTPRLLAMLQSKTPPTVADLKALPKHSGYGQWVVYVLILEKAGARPKSYIGGSTLTRYDGAAQRLRGYKQASPEGYKLAGLSSQVAAAVLGGWKITQIRILCQTLIPNPNNQERYRYMFRILETILSLTLGMLALDRKRFYSPQLCTWDHKALEYDGLCTTLAIQERDRGVVGECKKKPQSLDVVSQDDLRSVHQNLDNPDTVQHLNSGSAGLDRRLDANHNSLLGSDLALDQTSSGIINKLLAGEDQTATADYIVCKSWKLLSTTPKKHINVLHGILFPTQDIFAATVESARVYFAPGLLAILQSRSSPTLRDFATCTMPDDAYGQWVVYIIVLEKAGAQPKVYIGSGTATSQTAGADRLGRYGSVESIPPAVLAALNDGYTIALKRVICSAALPRPGRIYLDRALFLVLETVFTLAFWAIDSHYAKVSVNKAPLLCCWDVSNQGYGGLCHQLAIQELIRSNDGCTFTLAMIPFMEAKEKRHHEARIQATRALTAKSQEKAIQAKRFYCTTCDKAFANQHLLNRHDGGPGHSNMVTYGRQLSKAERKLLDWRPRCETCQLDFSDMSDLRDHNLEQHGPQGSKGGWCYECSNDFVYPTKLRSHQSLNVHKLVVRYGRPTTSQERTLIDKKYACHSCGRLFMYPADLRGHENRSKIRGACE